MSDPKAIIGSSDAASHIVLDFKPREFRLSSGGVAEQTFQTQQQGSKFRLAEQAVVKAGIDELQRKSVEQKVEELLLERLKEVQEKAYEEAYKLGREEGHADAKRNAEAEFKEQIGKLHGLLIHLESLEQEILKANEAALIKLTFEIAKRIAFQEIEQNRGVILQVFKDVIGSLAQEDRIVVWLHPKDKEFIESVQSNFAQEFAGKAKFEVSETITPGGCKVETLYGATDATLEERVQRAWQSLETRVPKPDGDPK